MTQRRYTSNPPQYFTNYYSWLKIEALQGHTAMAAAAPMCARFGTFAQQVQKLTWQTRWSKSILCNTLMENVPVLPVPDWAWAIVSRPEMTGMIAFCWITDGFSKP
jgi:hypothetical protein